MNEVITLEARNTLFQKTVAAATAKLQTKAVKLAIDIMQSYPEYSSEWIQCKKYDYGMDEARENQIKPAQYTFRVLDPNEKYETRVISPEDVAQAIPQLWMMVTAGTIHLCGLTAGTIHLCGLTDETFWDAGSWDSEASDALLQVYFYGETVYG